MKTVIDLYRHNVLPRLFVTSILRIQCFLCLSREGSDVLLLNQQWQSYLLLRSTSRSSNQLHVGTSWNAATQSESFSKRKLLYKKYICVYQEKGESTEM